MYKFEKGELVPYMYTFNKKNEFAKEEYQTEYEYNGEKEPSWWKKTKSFVSNLFSDNNKDSDEEVANEENKK